MRVTILTLLAAQALAFPMVKRQSEVLTSVVTQLTALVPTTIGGPSLATPTALPSASLPSAGLPSAPLSALSSAVLSPISAASSAISSAQASALAPATSAASSAASAVPSLFPGALAYPCPPGTSLTYVETQSNVNASLADVIAATGNFGNSTLFQISNVTGTNNTVGQTRTVAINSTSANEILTNYTVNAQTNAVYLTWNATNAATVNGLTVGAYSTEQQVYINDTETSATAPVSTIKLFSNICASGSEAEAQAFFLAFFEQAIANGTAAATGAQLPSGVQSAIPSASALAPVSSALSSASSVISAAASSAIAVLPTQAVSSISSNVASQISSVASSAAGALPSAAPGAATGVMINTPASVVQCQPVSINFSGGQAPYFLSILPGGQATAAPLLQFEEQPAAGSYVWRSTIAAGTSITFAVRDAAGTLNYSSPVTIQPSNDASCLIAPTTSA